MTDDIEQQAEDVRGRGRRGDTATRNSGDSNGMYKRILEALIVAAVLALAGAFWNLQQSSILLAERQDAMRRDIDRIERRQDSLEGKITRGEPDASHQ